MCLSPSVCESVRKSMTLYCRCGMALFTIFGDTQSTWVHLKCTMHTNELHCYSEFNFLAAPIYIEFETKRQSNREIWKEGGGGLVSSNVKDTLPTNRLRERYSAVCHANANNTHDLYGMLYYVIVHNLEVNCETDANTRKHTPIHNDEAQKWDKDKNNQWKETGERERASEWQKQKWVFEMRSGKQSSLQWKILGEICNANGYARRCTSNVS